MAITTQGLIKLGFKTETDFVLQDDGAGAYIKEWKSGSPQPTESEIETAHATAQTEFDDAATAKTTNTASAKTKLKALGLTDDELRDAFGL